MSRYSCGVWAIGLLTCCAPALCDAQEKILWPIPGATDIRGTYCDYRDTPQITFPYFHGGIDIHCDAGTWAYPPVAQVQVVIIDSSGVDTGTGATLYLKDTQFSQDGIYERFRYGHVTTRDAYGHTVEVHIPYPSHHPITTVADWQGGGGDLDHLHFEVSALTRNPLWVSDNPHREVDVPVAPAAPEIIAVAIGPYDSEGTFDDCGVPDGEPITTFDKQDVDIVVFAGGPGSQVGVRGLAYCVLNEGHGQPGESDWKHFCDFTDAPPAGGWTDAHRVYAFGGLNTD